MTTRHNNLKAIRPTSYFGKLNENMSSDERFQNETLRPIIKFQKDLFVEVFKNYIKKHKSMFYDLTIAKKVIYIENTIQKDIKFRNSIKGMIIGQFTIEEYLLYIENSSALNKRMMNIVKNQLVDNIQIFDIQLSQVV
ncbi:glyoxalase [Formosa sediminum]|uniref:Glyoxalase n=1 Tax=Formosa sediminum TaxID=2594004 RepID=A0A516GTZ8_9FLAO|nr:glyoxalase [Formosa sediminum]QDO94988.1 glyoxalase [Formosa sediminum]